MSLMVGEGSRRDCTLDMAHYGLRVVRLRVLLGVVGNSLTEESTESRWGVLSKDVGCRKDCSCRSSRPSLLRVVSRAPSPPFCDPGAWLPRGLLDQRHQQRLLSLRRIVRDSCFDFGFGFRVDDRRRRTTKLAAVCRVLFGSRHVRCKSDHHRTLLKQVHLLCFHAYYGCAQ